jgi:hypothetical protein
MSLLDHMSQLPQKNYLTTDIHHLGPQLNEHLRALKNRFKILTQRPFIPLKSQIKVVVACCALHNWILENGTDEYVVDEATWYANLPRSSGHIRDREADIREWAAKRDLIAQQMWEDKESAQE